MATNKTNDEIDLAYLLNKVNEMFKNLSIAFYNAIQFVIKRWYIFLILILIGIGLGYYIEKDIKLDKVSTLIIRTNFDTARYAYHALSTLEKKSIPKDSMFLLKNGFRADSTEIRKIEVKPMVNFNELSDNFVDKDRIIDALLRNVEFKDEEVVSNSFFSDYKYHEVELVLSSHANEGTITKIINYLNNDDFVIKRVETGKKILEENIALNEFSIKQIDSTISNYNDKTFLPSSTAPFVVVDKNFSYAGVLIEKSRIQNENTKLKEELVYAENAVVRIDKPNMVFDKGSKLKKKYVLYPIIFVFCYVFGLWLLNKYKRIQKEVWEKNLLRLLVNSRVVGLLLTLTNSY